MAGKRHPNHLKTFIMVFLFSMLSSCGGGSNSGPISGSLAFSLIFEKPVIADQAPHIFMASSPDVCVDYGIQTIVATVRDSSYIPVANATWTCAAHAGSLSVTVDASKNYLTFEVEGRNSSGAALWSGNKTGIVLYQNQTTSTGSVSLLYVGNDQTRPTVSSYSASPADNATNVPVTSSIAASFSESIAASSIDASTFRLWEGANPVAGAVTYESATKTARFTPASNLAYSTLYTATLATGVTDMAGNAMLNAYSWSFTTEAALGSAPSAPTGVTATAGDKQITVSWNAVSGATSYNIYWSTTAANANRSSGTKIISITDLYTQTSLTNGQTYYYVVTAINSYGESAESAQVSATPSSLAATAPTGVTATPGNGQTTISWAAVAGATTYNIYWSTTSGVTKTTGTKISNVISPHTHSGLTNGTSYYYVVTSANSYGESGESSQASATPQAAGTVLSAPTGLTAAAVSSNTIKLEWTYTNSGVSKTRGIAIARKTSATGFYSIVGSVPSDIATFVDKELNPLTTYYYKLYAYETYDPSTKSSYTPEVNATTLTFSNPPSAPSGLLANAINGWTVDLTWVDNSNEEDGFIIERSSDDINYLPIETTDANVTAFKDNYVMENMTYYYRIKSYNNAGNSSYTSPVVVITPSISPTNLSGALGVNTTLSLANSPYLVSGTLALAPGYKLVIEPGVHIRFASSTKLDIRGNLEAVGTNLSPITFTAADPTSGSQNYWSGIHVANNLGGSAILQHAIISNASSAVSVDCCWGSGPVEIFDSEFKTNAIALNGYAGWDIKVYRSLFLNNNTGANSADKIIAYSKFKNNTYGLYATERISVFYSIFTGHSEVALYGGRRDVKYCTLTNNKIGVKAFFEGFNLSYNTIANNSDTGIILGSYDSTTTQVNFNNIYDNMLFNIKNNDALEKNAKNNWWGTTYSTNIDSKIWDFYDDVNLGIITYYPVLSNTVDIIP